MQIQLKLLAGILLFLSLLSRFAGAGTLTFKPAVSYPVGITPNAATAGDFNGDGKADLVVANFGSASDEGGISILLGNDDGTVQPSSNFAAGKKPHALAPSDFNRDGKEDLVLIDSSGVGVLLGNGDGTFGPVSYLPTASFPHSLAVSDLNGDNIPDLVVAASSLSVLLGNGDGTFQSHADYSGIGGSIAVADVNGDGKLDVVLSGNGIDVLLGNGDGSLKSATFSTSPYFTVGLVAADFNLDDKLDLAVSFNNLLANQSGAVIMPGNGDGTFQLPGSNNFQSFGSMSAADFNGDGKADLVIVSGGIANLFLGNGDGAFQSPLTFAVGAGPWSLATADLNDDKAPDLMVTNSADNTISVLLNNGTDFSISASKATPGTVSPGQSATSAVTVALLNNFDNSVALACSVQPAGPGAPSCSLSANSVTPQPNGSATATLTINAGSAATSASSSAWLFAPVLALAGLGALIPRRKRRLTRSVVGAVLFAGLLLPIACGGGSGGRAAQTYTVTVTGSSGFAQHSTSLTVGVLTRSVARISGVEEIAGNGQLHRTAVLAIAYDKSMNHARGIFQSLVLSVGTNVPVVLTSDNTKLFPRD
jgi:hypothetical protein